MKTVRELKQLVPLADVAEIRSDARYLVKLDARMSMQEIENVGRNLEQFGIRAILCDSHCNFYELDAPAEPTGFSALPAAEQAEQLDKIFTSASRARIVHDQLDNGGPQVVEVTRR